MGYAGYMFFDNLTFLDAAGIRRSEAAKTAQKQAYQAWMVGLVFSAVQGFYKLSMVKSQQAGVDREKGEGVVEAKRLERYVLDSTESSFARTSSTGALIMHENLLQYMS